MRFLTALPVFFLFLAACGDKSAVSLSADISAAALNVRPTAFGSALSGSFQLNLNVGPEASGAATVMLGNFSVQSAAGAPLIDVLPLETTSVFPLVVDKGSTKQAAFTFMVDSVDRTALCTGQVRIVGSVMDSLKGGTDPVSSALIATDCPPAI